MANTLKKNVYHVDTVGTLTADRMQPMISAIQIVPNATNSHVIVKESVSGTIVIDIIISTTESRYISYEALPEKGILVTGSFEVTELTNVDRILLYGAFKKTANEPG